MPALNDEPVREFLDLGPQLGEFLGHAGDAVGLFVTGPGAH